MATQTPQHEFETFSPCCLRLFSLQIPRISTFVDHVVNSHSSWNVQQPATTEALEDAGFDQFSDTWTMGTNLKPQLSRPPEPHGFSIFNDNYHPKLNRGGGNRDENAFPLFGLLPAELRLRIWVISLEQHRFLRTVLYRPTERTMDEVPDEADWPSELSTSSLADDESGLDSAKKPTYRVFFLNTPPSSALYEACSESARVARSFYSIPVPYSLTPPRETTWPGQHSVTAVNPEWDILDIHSSDNSRTAEHIVEFLHDLRTADPRGKGTASLCIDQSQVKALAELNISRLAAPILESYKATVAGLCRLYWRTVPEEQGRVMAGWPYHTQTLPWYNVSMPLMADLSTIRFTGTDIRPIAPDLHQVWFGHDPRNLPALWDQVERNLGVCTGSQKTTRGQNAGLQCRILLASEPSTRIIDRASVDIYLASEVQRFCNLLDDEWAGLPLHKSMWRTALGRYAPEVDTLSMNSEEFATLRVSTTAVGFWLLDPEVLGPVSDDPITAYYQSKTVINISKLAIKPELCLFSFSKSISI